MMNRQFFVGMVAVLVLTLTSLTACQQGGDPGVATSNSTSNNIVFIRLDSITKQYTALATKLEALEAKVTQMDAAQQERAQALQRDIQSFQRRAQSGRMAPKNIGIEEERLAGRQQALMQEAEQARQELQLEQLKLEAEFSENVKKVLREIQAEFNYDYILNYGGNSAVAMVNEAYDITPEVVKRINLIPMDGQFDNKELSELNEKGEEVSTEEQ
ncbi:MAG: OmpH family outer membrane protein [Bacteroidetes bacterium]|nr:MAG: OmpH family outer membrane protein [Bacteroidota bacterium]